jgi:acetyl-CoA carboxylase carboxyltransferase component
VQRIFCAHERADEQALAIAAILDRRLALGAGGAVAGDEFHVVLNQVIAAARRRFPAVHELALEVRHALFDEPMFEQTRAAIHRHALGHVDALERSARPEALAACVDALIDCPQPLIALLVPRLSTASAAARAAMLEALTRRYYRHRAVTGVGVHADGGAHHVTAAYDSDGRRITVLTTYAARAELPAAVRRLAPWIAAAGDPRDVVVDFYTWSAAPLGSPEAGEAEVRAQLAAGGLPAGLCRVVVATAPLGDGAIQCVTYRGADGGYVEDARYRGVHPMIGRRMHFWRLAGFELERLPSVEDVHLYRGIARTNPRDERLFAMGEVRDLTPVRDAAGRIVQLPYLERVLGEALAALRRIQAARPARDRLQWNRVILNFWPPLTLSDAELGDVVRRLAPDTEGLGIEQVVVHARVPALGADAAGELREAVLRISNTLDGGLHLRVTEPPDYPIATLTEYEQKVIALRRRGLIYAYEIVRLLAPRDAGAADGLPRGEFVEHDLDPAGALVPVDREPGLNTANIVAGVLRNFTPDVPEGVTRVVLLGDAHKEMGSLAEPECRRILAAIDLAERMAVPLEWFALSAGAKISRQSGTENMDWIAAVLRRIIEFTQRGGEINIVVCGINVGGQPYWNAEATMLMHTRGILVMIGDAAMVLTGKQALDYSGSTSAEDNQGIGGYERIMGVNGQAQYWAVDLGHACRILLAHYAHTYVVPGERFPRRTATADPRARDVCGAPHPGELATIGDVFGPRNADRKRSFDIRAVMRAISDLDHEPLERWRDQRDAEIAVVWDAHLGGVPLCMIGIESHALPRRGYVPADGPVQWTSGTLFPRASRKIARALNAASGNRPVVVVANLAGFDGSPESMRELQLEYGAEIGRAVVNFDGPIVFCVVSRYHGGAFVVFSKQLNDQLEVIAVEGARASVIGGAPAAAVVFARDVDTRTAKDPRIVALEDALAKAPPADKVALRDRLAELRPAVRSEKLGEVADEFDRIHSVQRALAVGSLDRIVPAAALRPELIDAVERGIARTLARRRAAHGDRRGA